MENQGKSKVEWFKVIEDERKLRQIGFAILKPDAVSMGITRNIFDRIEVAGLKIVFQEKLTLSKNLITQLYGNRIFPEWSDELFSYLTSGQSIVLIVSGLSASKRLMEIRDEIRKEYGCDFLHNLIHTSDNCNEASDEIKLFLGIGSL